VPRRASDWEQALLQLPGRLDSAGLAAALSRSVSQFAPELG